MTARLLVGNRSANIKAITYVCERSHPSYTGRLPLAEQVRLIRGARGVSGCNLTYLINTVRHLEKLGVREPELERVMSLAGPHFTRMHGSVHLDRAARSLLACCLRWPVHVPLMRPSERRRFNHRKQIAQWSLP